MKTLIIAEAGVNHNGDYSLATKLVDAAARAGVDFVKFQTFKAAKLVSKKARQADYQSLNTKNEFTSQYEMLAKLEMPDDWHRSLIAYAEGKGVRFLSTAFDEDSVDFLNTLNPPFFKIPSGEVTNKPYLRHVASKGKPILLSTGMASLQEVGDALAIIEQAGLSRSQVTLLQCNTEYPTPMQDVNLNAMVTMRNTFQVKVGYSDHTPGIEVPIAAVALGAVVIEKHLTLDRNLPGPDHKASLEPDEMKAMTEAIRNIESAMGDGVKKASASEQKNIAIARKSIHTSMPLVRNTILRDEHLTMKRPGDGISPMLIDSIIGKKVSRDLPADHKLSEGDLQ